MQLTDAIQGQSTGRPEKGRTVGWIPLFVYPDLVLVVVCGRDQCCLSVRFTCLLCECTVLCSNCGESHRSHQNVRNDEIKCRFAKEHLTWLWTTKKSGTLICIKNEHYHESLCLLLYFVGRRFVPFNKTVFIVKFASVSS